MKLSHIAISNYRSLRDFSVRLDRFVCIVGKNNSGKSSILQCLTLFASGRKLAVTDYYDATLPIRIELSLTDVDAADLAAITDDEHRRRIASLLDGGTLRLVRRYDANAGKSSMQVVQRVPREERLRPRNVDELVKGKSRGELRAAAVERIPEVDSVLATAPTQADVKTAVEAYVAALTPDQLEESDQPLPTGLDKSITPLLPEVIYIPAVKDVTDEIKTTESATFGKLLGILFDAIEHEFGDIEEQLQGLQRKLSRVTEDGRVIDARLPKVKLIEETIERFIQENFTDVTLQISVPAPELRTVLNSAEITANDGYTGPIASKGDGLKRIVTFAILRSYAEFRDAGLEQAAAGSAVRPRYLLLFEEPELYLHPSAQRQLFNALSVFAKDHPVIVTTHSPTFVSADSTKLFVKLYKRQVDGQAPAADKCIVNLNDLSIREQLQLIVHHNNEAALFCDEVLLVEGDSDYVAISHLLELFRPDLISSATHVSVVRVGGKQSMSRYKTFFDLFGVRTHALCDLDALTNGFGKLGPSAESAKVRGQLMERLDAVGAAEHVRASSVADVREGGDGLSLYRTAIEQHKAWQSDAGRLDDLIAALDRLFERVYGPLRYATLTNSDDAEVARLKGDLIARLREEDIYILSRGHLEDYYARAVAGSDKVERAISFRGACTNVQDLDQLPSIQGCPTATEEFAAIFARLHTNSL